MSCSCMFIGGVLRKDKSQYVCATCAQDCSRAFHLLLDVDEGYADLLIERGLRRMEQTKRQEPSMKGANR